MSDPLSQYYMFQPWFQNMPGSTYFDHNDQIDMQSTGSCVPPALIERQSKTNLYIKGLPENFTDDALENLVPDKNKIKSLKAALEDDMRCKGYGFIDFLTEEDARKALEHIQSNNPQFNAKFAKENEKDKTNLYVTNIPKEWTSKDSDKLKSYFEKFGSIQSAFIMIEKSTNKTVGVGFVRFVSEVNAHDALEQLQKGIDFLPNCDRAIEAKYADKHNPETRKRRNPTATAALAAGFCSSGSGVGVSTGNSAAPSSTTPLSFEQLQTLRSVNFAAAATAASNCLINPNVALSNSLYGALYSQPQLLLRNHPQSGPGVITGDPSHPYIDLGSLYSLAAASAVTNSASSAGAGHNPYHTMAPQPMSLDAAGMDQLLAYSQLANNFTFAAPLPNTSVAAPPPTGLHKSSQSSSSSNTGSIYPSNHHLSHNPHSLYNGLAYD